MVVDAAGGVAKLKNALRDVAPGEGRAEDLRQLAIGVAAVEIHLPQPVLSRYIALRDEEILLGCRFDMRYAVGIAPHGGGRRQSGEVNIAVENRERGEGYRPQPEQARRDCHGQKHYKTGGRPRKPAKPAAFARFLQGH